MVSKVFSVKAEVWLYPGMAGWHFVTLPKKTAADIKSSFGKKARGWGSLPVEVVLGKTKWKTSIFPDKKSESYLFPVKAEVRKKEKIGAGDMVGFKVRVLV
ncbi:MAG: DUF1905 domain-containing protein [Anaplasmataceae bacterium]|nr:DUF1905 domain-containing protein [Anaplasmataceae bacterium]